jgi:hypothetical protein
MEGFSDVLSTNNSEHDKENVINNTSTAKASKRKASGPADAEGDEQTSTKGGRKAGATAWTPSENLVLVQQARAAGVSPTTTKGSSLWAQLVVTIAGIL